MEAPKLKAFVVSTTWSDGISSLAMSVMVYPEMAAGAAVVDAMRREPHPTGDLVALMVREVEPAVLRMTLQQLETGKASGDIVQLVPQAPAPEAAPQQVSELGLGIVSPQTFRSHVPQNSQFGMRCSRCGLVQQQWEAVPWCLPPTADPPRIYGDPFAGDAK